MGKPSKQWRKSSRYRAVFANNLSTRNRLRLHRMLVGRGPFKVDPLADGIFMMTQKLEDHIFTLLAKPSPWLDVIKRGTYVIK